ncbi:GAF-like protein [Gracilaria domingensis]|nr:GAF-like protein [Gracilaria domingensis]
MLPRSPTVEVKHKVHILDHAITALQHMHQENANLELFLAMRSRPRVVAWVDSFIPTATTIQSALNPLIDLISHTGAWPYAEVWESDPPNMSLVHSRLRGAPMQYPALSTLARFSAAHHKLPIASDFAGRSFETRAPFWTATPSQLCQVVNRAQLMAAARLNSAFSVPIPVAGEIPFVVSFYDVRQRERDPAQLHSASFAAVCLGNAWAAKQAETLAS